MIKLHLAEEEVETVVDTGASASVVGKCLACKLGIWKIVRKVEVRQRNGSYLEGNFVLDTLCKLMNFSLVVSKFAMDVEV